MKNSLIVIGVLVLQLFLTTKGAMAMVSPYINEVRSVEKEMEYKSLCSTRKLFANNILKNLNNPSETKLSKIASK